MPDSPSGTDPVAALVDECVGENLDQLISLDMRGDGISRILMAAARTQVGAPLAFTAARRLRDSLSGGGCALLLTGFIVPPWGVGETDGLIGTVVLGRALERALGAQLVVVSEQEILPPLAAGFQEAGLLVYRGLDARRDLAHSVVLLPFPRDGEAARDEARRIADAVSAAACVAVERPGRNAVGEYHYALGKNVTEWIAPLDLLYEEAAGRGAITVGVGDFGNELGMGAIADVVRAETPAGSDCGCPCGAGIACPTAADVTVACSVSDWGAYAIAAALSYLEGDPAVFTGPREYARILEATVRGGCIDGASNYAVPAVDGIAQETNIALVELLRDSAAYPASGNRFQAIRDFRAAREGGGV
jgi:hypothetical protein